MISILKLLTEENKFFVPERSREERKENFITIQVKKINNYIENGSEGSLTISNTPLTRVPDNLKYVDGNLDLRSNNIQYLPKGLTVKGTFKLSSNPISTLPDDLSVGGDLFITHTKVDTIPKNLNVGGTLWIHQTPLTRINTQGLNDLIKNQGGNVRDISFW